jgi:hypothetical protein
MVVAALALAGPVAYGAASGHLLRGSLAALGALAATGVAAGGRRPAVQLVAMVPVVAVAGLVAVSVSGRGWLTAAVVTGLAASAAVVGGFNRWTAEASTRFTILVVIASGLGNAIRPLEATQYFVLGACWAIALSMLLRPPKSTSYPYKALWRRWTRSLSGLDGWRFAVELTACMLLAEVAGAVWHQSKAYWIALTVVIVVRRSSGSLIRALQRCAGTCAGVLIGSALVLWVPPMWIVVALVAVLAGARPYLRARNYAAYATVMTPLVVLLLDLGRPTSLSTMGYRLLDTVIGCGIALGIGWLPEWFRRSREMRSTDGDVG